MVEVVVVMVVIRERNDINVIVCVNEVVVVEVVLMVTLLLFILTAHTPMRTKTVTLPQHCYL